MIRMRPALRALAIFSILELVSVGLLLLNVVTLHLPSVTSFLGPTHGTLFLAVVVTAVFARGLLARTRWMALIPVAGGILTLVNVRIEARRPRRPAPGVADVADSVLNSPVN